MKAVIGLFTVLLFVGCASTWVDPKLNFKNSRIIIECTNDPLGLGPALEHAFGDEGIEAKALEQKVSGDLVLKVTYRFVRAGNGTSTIQSVKADMIDPRYRSQEARYQWDGQGDTQAEAARRLVEAILAR